MNPTEFVHITLLAFGGTVRGKTALQKKIFFLGVLTDSLDDLGYRPHFYGPHSDDVAQAVQELKTIGYVEQDIRSVGCADSAGFERRRYDYRLTDAGKRVAEVKAQENHALWSKIQDVVKKLDNAGDLDYMKLSIAAKTYFLLRQSSAQPSKDEVTNVASSFGWCVTSEEAREAATYLERLDLLPQSA